MPTMPTQTGPASPYIRSLETPLLAILILQTCMCGCRLVIFLDIMGGFIMAIGTAFGWYGWKEDMHITHICYWGCFCLLNGAFDTVRWLDQTVKSPSPLFSRSLPLTYNATSAISMMIPVSVLVGAPLAWHIYKHTLDFPGERSRNIDMDSFGGSGGARPFSRNAFGNSAAWKVFSGSGQRLGDA